MKKYISPLSFYITLHGESPLLDKSIEIDPGEDVDDDDKTRRQDISPIWDSMDD